MIEIVSLFLIGVTGLVLWRTLKYAREDMVQPAVVAGATFTWFYLFDMIYAILVDYRLFGSRAFVLSGYRFDYHEWSLIIDGLLVGICALSMQAGFWAARWRSQRYGAAKPHEPLGRVVSAAGRKLLSTITLIALGVAVLLMMSVIVSLGGVSWYFQNIGHRAAFFMDST